MRDLVVIGAGGFGRETIDTIRAINRSNPQWRLLGVIDDDPSDANLRRLEAMGAPYLGDLTALPSSPTSIAISVGSPASRRRIASSLNGHVYHFPELIHPNVIIGEQFATSEGLVVLGGVSIGVNVTLGSHTHINANAVLGHDTLLEDYVSVNPSATISGNVRVGSCTLIGAASVILQGLTVGSGSLVGAGACVTRDIVPNSTVKGVPAR